MAIQRSLNTRRDLIAALVVLTVAVGMLQLSGAPGFATLNIILDTCAFLLAAVLAFLLWDLGWRTGQTLTRHMAACFVAYSVMEMLHVYTALDVSSCPLPLQWLSTKLRLGTLAPAAYLLPISMTAIGPAIPSPSVNSMDWSRCAACGASSR